MVHVEHVMGTAVSFTLPGVDAAPPALARAVRLLHDADERFSTYRDDSEVCGINRGEIREADASSEMLEVLAVCEEMRVATGGAFDIRAHRPHGMDPSGVVKGWALQRAAAALAAAGIRDACVNGGGDVVAMGHAEPGRAWRIGIRHPDAAERVAAVLALSDLTVATSALYERGAHVVDPRTGRAPGELRSATVVGPDLTYADAWATAVLVLGVAGLERVARMAGLGAYGITAGGRVIWTPDLDALLVS